MIYIAAAPEMFTSERGLAEYDALLSRLANTQRFSISNLMDWRASWLTLLKHHCHIATSGSDNSPISAAAVMPKVPVMADTQGRLRVAKAQRRDILAAFGNSGESLPRFARWIGLKYSTLARWVQRNRPKQSPGRKPPL